MTWVLAAVILALAAGPARAADVAVGEGIVVAELSAAEVRRVVEAGDGAAALAGLVSPALPPEYHAATRLAAGGWAALRTARPAPAGVRVVLTLNPPGMAITATDGPTAAEVVRAHVVARGRATDHVRAAFRQAAGTLDAAHRDLAERLAASAVLTAVRERLTFDPAGRWCDSVLATVPRPIPRSQP